MSAQPNEFDPLDRNPAARLNELDRLRLLRQPGAGTRMAERLRQAEATGNYHEVAVPKDRSDGRHDISPCRLYHPDFRQASADPGDPDGLCVDCRAEATALHFARIEAQWKAARRRQILLGTLGMRLPEWLYSLVVIVSAAAMIVGFAWGVGK